MATKAATSHGYPAILRRISTGRIIDTAPAAGRNWMYTSGWPKIQKMCCHSSELPPATGSKNFMS